MIVRQSTVADIHELSLIHVKAFRGHMNAYLGRVYSKAFIRWFIQNDDTICLTAESETKQLGYVCGAEIGYNQKLNKDLLLTVALCFVMRPHLFFNKEIMKIVKTKIQILLGSKSLLKDVVKHLPGKGISLVSICSDENSPVKGIGTALIAEFEKQAQLLKFDYMRLSVKSENTKAINFYERNGWKYLCKSREDILYYYKSL